MTAPPKIALVVAIARNGAIGIDDGLPWRLPGDLAFFKRTTMGKPILMGRKTWQSLPRRPLPGRPNIVVSRAMGAQEAEGAHLVHSLEDGYATANTLAVQAGADEICVIGGAEIYRQALERADRIYLTEVNAEPAADTFFPAFDRTQWDEAWREPGPPAADAPPYSFVLLTRKAR